LALPTLSVVSAAAGSAISKNATPLVATSVQSFMIILLYRSGNSAA
jgi:hypothetical protein